MVTQGSKHTGVQNKIENFRGKGEPTIHKDDWKRQEVPRQGKCLLRFSQMTMILPQSSIQFPAQSQNNKHRENAPFFFFQEDRVQKDRGFKRTFCNIHIIYLKYILSGIYFVPCTVLGAEDTNMSDKVPTHRNVEPTTAQSVCVTMCPTRV